MSKIFVENSFFYDTYYPVTTPLYTREKEIVLD
jgi:hypothetical protein